MSPFDDTTAVPLLFLDCETTGLHPTLHTVWEIGAITAWHITGPEVDDYLAVNDTVELVVDLDPGALARQDPVAANLTRFDDRYHAATRVTEGAAARALLDALDRLALDCPTAGSRLWPVHLVGAVPSFDDRRVGDLLERCGHTRPWHYHLIDVEALAAGCLAVPPPWKSEELCKLIGLAPTRDTAHEALSDARWALEVYASVYDLDITGW